MTVPPSSGGLNHRATGSCIPTTPFVLGLGASVCTHHVAITPLPAGLTRFWPEAVGCGFERALKNNAGRARPTSPQNRSPIDVCTVQSRPPSGLTRNPNLPGPAVRFVAAPQTDAGDRYMGGGRTAGDSYTRTPTRGVNDVVCASHVSRASHRPLRKLGRMAAPVAILATASRPVGGRKSEGQRRRLADPLRPCRTRLLWPRCAEAATGRRAH